MKYSPMGSDAAKLWAEQRVKEGMNREEAKQKLIDAGYAEDDAEAAVREAKITPPTSGHPSQVAIIIMGALFLIGGVTLIVMHSEGLTERVFPMEDSPTQEIQETPTDQEEPEDDIAEDESEDKPIDDTHEEDASEDILPEDDFIEDDTSSDDIQQYPESEFDVSDCIELPEMLEECEEFSCIITHSLSPDIITIEVRGYEDGYCRYASGYDDDMAECRLPESYMDAMVESAQAVIDGEERTYIVDGEEVDDPLEKAIREGHCD